MKVRLRERTNTKNTGVNYISSEKSSKLKRKLKIISCILFLSLCFNIYNLIKY